MKKNHPITAGTRLLFTGIFLTAFSLLAFEVAMTRMLSVLISYHFVFAVLSLALMGQGLGALYQAFRTRPPDSPAAGMHELSTTAAWCALTMGLATTLLLALAHGSPRVSLFLVVIIPPFFVGGIFFARAFYFFSSESSGLYAADLAGAGGGCIGVLLLLQKLSASQTLYVLALVVLSGSFVLNASSKAMRHPNRSSADDPAEKMLPRIPRLSLLAALVLVPLLVAALTIDDMAAIPVGENPEKEISAALARGNIEKTVWSAFGQTDLIAYPGFDHRKDMYIDGTAGTPMYRFTGNILDPGPAVRNLLDTFPGYLPLKALQPDQTDSCLIIGPGGGRDILLALSAGFSDIEAVEVNADFVDMVKSYSAFNGGLLTDIDTVRDIVAEGRSHVRRQAGAFDLILMSLPATNSSRSREGIALTENFLLTREAVIDYLTHLTPEGRLVVVTHGEVEALRLVATALAAFETQGLSTPASMEHLIVIGHEEYPVLEISKEPVSRQRVKSLAGILAGSDYTPMSSYLPLHPAHIIMNPVLTGLANGSRTLNQVIGWAAERGFDISPVSDNRPFFFKFEPGVPRSVVWVFTIGTVLLIATAGLMIKILRYPGRKRTLESPGKPPLRHMTWMFFLFSGLGAGFMMVEISMAQQCFLFIGRPVISIAVILFSLLFGAGIGGMVSRGKSPDTLSRSLPLHLLIVILVLAAGITCLPLVFSSLLGHPFPVRLAAVSAFLIILGFCMGFPFPIALRILSDSQRSHWIPWALGVNGIASVLGSAGCVAVATVAGSIQALWLGTGCYAFCIGIHALNRRLEHSQNQ